MGRSNTICTSEAVGLEYLSSFKHKIVVLLVLSVVKPLPLKKDGRKEI